MKKYCGIDLGGTNIAAGIVDEEYHILASASAPTPKGVDGVTLAAAIARVAEQAAAKAGLTIAELDGVGMGAPGYIDSERGINRFAGNLGLTDDPMAENLSRCLGGMAVRLGNDANVAAYAESIAGAARGTRRSVMVTLGTGIGVGVIIDGSDRGMAAEGGHMVIRVNGRPCTCGHRGCFEAYASATALILQTQEAMEKHPESLLWELCGGDLEKVTGKIPFDGRDAGDATAIAVVEQYLDYLAFGISNLIDLLEPDAMVIGGGICAQGDKLLVPLRERARRMVYHPLFADRCKFAIAELGNDAGIIGAAGLAGQGPLPDPTRR
jgi:glucokinase